MGCFGCSLAASTLTAVVLGLVESIIGMTWNILVIVVIEMHRATNESATGNGTTDSFFTEDGGEIPAEFIIGDNSSDWETFKFTLSSTKAMEEAHIFELSVTALVLNSFWLISTLALAVGNAEKCRDMLKPWIVTTGVITITDTAATIYFIFRAVKDTSSDDTEVEVERLFVENIFVILATLFSRGGPLIWIANIALCIFVAQRVKQIEVMKKKRMPFDADLRVPPYALHSPYEAYDSDSYRCEKNFRPNTPPPDYGGGGFFHNKKSNHNGRKHSPPSDCENSTLPVSLRSGSSLHRPMSGAYHYDDQVEMQHRASLAAEAHHYHHVYDNKGLDNDSAEGWIGIPRPTLRITR